VKKDIACRLTDFFSCDNVCDFYFFIAFSSAYIQYLWPVSLMQLYAGLQLST